MWLVKPMLYSAKTQQGCLSFLMPPGISFFYLILKGSEEIVDVRPLGCKYFKKLIITTLYSSQVNLDC